MPNHAVTRMGLSAALILAAAIPVLAQDSAITGARVTVVEKPAGTLLVGLQNLRDSPLVAWELRVRSGATSPGIVSSTDFTGPGPYVAGDGPLSPLEQRVVRIQTSSVAADAAVVMQLAVFADGYYEGESEAAAEYRGKRERRADDLRFWLAALQGVPRGSDDEIRTYLRDQLARHAARPDAAESIAASRIRSLALEDVPRAPDWISSLLERQATEMRAHLTRLEQSLKPPSDALAGHVGAVAVAITGTPQGRFYVVVDNVTSVPIDAFGLRYEGGTRMRSFLFSSANGAPGQGPIQPGEKREVPVSIGFGDRPDRPDVTLLFLLFADLRFEGPRSERDEVLRILRGRSAEMTFTIATLSEAIQQPSDKIVDFLESKKRERAVAMAGTREGRGFTGEIDEIIRLAKSLSASHAVTHASHLIAQLEANRARITRHLGDQ